MGQSALYAKEAPIPQQTKFRGEKHQRKWYPTSCSTNLGHDNLTALADKPHKPSEMIWINVFQFSSKKQHKFRVTNIQNVKFNFFVEVGTSLTGPKLCVLGDRHAACRATLQWPRSEVRLRVLAQYLLAITHKLPLSYYCSNSHTVEQLATIHKSHQ